MFKSGLYSFICLFLVSFFVQAKEVVIIDAEDDWAPYSSKVDDLPKGFSVDVVKAIFNSQNVDVQLNSVSYAKCLDHVSRNTEVVGCFDTARSYANENKFYWTDKPLFKAKIFIWARKDYKKNDLTYTDLIGQKVGMTNGYEYGTKFDSGPPGEVEKDIGPTDQSLFKKLLFGRFDLAVAYELPAKNVLNQLKLAKEKAGVKPVGKLTEISLYVSFSKMNKNSQHFLAVYNKGMDTIIKNGTYKKLFDVLNAEFK